MDLYIANRTVVDSYTVSAIGYAMYTPVTKRGQSFLAIDGILNRAVFRLYRIGSPSGNVQAEIHSHTGTYGIDSISTGITLATSETVDISTIGTSSEWVYFSFTGSNRITLVGGTHYCLICTFDGGGNSSNCLIIRGDASLPTHGGNAMYESGSWVASNTIDHTFYLYIDDILYDSIDNTENISGNILDLGNISVNETIGITDSNFMTYTHFISIFDELVISDIPDIPPRTARIKINDIDRTRYITLDSLVIENVLTSQVDTCNFTIKKISGSTSLNYKPIIGNEVVITYYNDRIFGGAITKVTQQVDSYGILEFLVECIDYTRFLDRRLVADTFTQKTINEIIASITTEYLDGFSTAFVDCAVMLDYIGFNYIPVSKVFTDLAALVQHDWYIDYRKNIHFFAKNSRQAPFDLEDDTDTYITKSLQIKQDSTQLRNVIYVRGGEYLADTFTTEILCDGTNSIYNIPYKYEGLSVSTSAENWPTPLGKKLSVGLDYIDVAENYDVLWNFQEKVIKFRDSRIPNNGNVLRIGGKPYLPVRIKTSNRPSVREMSEIEGGSGEYEYVIIDESIKSRTAGLERADAELQAYKSTLIEGSFSTYTNGLVSGQQIRINSTLHEIDETYLINRVTTRIFAGEIMIYDVSLVTTKTYGLIEFLQDLILRENKTLSSSGSSVETIDLIENADEEVVFTDSIAYSTSHNPQSETIILTETKTEHALNWGVLFVIGPYIYTNVSTDVKRQFVCDGSRLG
jgi:hypothetical protein